MFNHLKKINQILLSLSLMALLTITTGKKLASQQPTYSPQTNFVLAPFLTPQKQHLVICMPHPQTPKAQKAFFNTPLEDIISKGKTFAASPDPIAQSIFFLATDNESGDTFLHNLIQHQDCPPQDLAFFADIYSKFPEGVNVPNTTSGLRPIHYAAIFSSPEFLQILIENDANIYSSVETKTPLSIAFETKKFDNAFTILYALKHYEHCNEYSSLRPDSNGFFAIHYAAQYATPQEIIALAGNNHGYLNKQTEQEQYTPLMLAIDSANKENVLFLLNKQVDIGIYDAFGNQAIHHAIQVYENTLANRMLLTPKEKQAQTDIINIITYHITNILHHNIDDYKTPNGNTALHLAAQKDNSMLFDFFCSRGANPVLPNNEGHSPRKLLAVSALMILNPEFAQ